MVNTVWRGRAGEHSSPLHMEQEFALEKLRLEKTITLAGCQLVKAIQDNEGNNAEILSIKQEMRDNAAQGGANLWDSQNFEDMVELSQFTNQISLKLLDVDTTAKRITMLEKLLASPYFARIDFKFADEATYEKIYIGRASLMDDRENEIYVYDWRSPIASMFYRFATGPASYEAPVGLIRGELNLKRQYEIKEGVLEYYFDADVQIVDEFLRKLLSQNTSPQMRAIVETIQKEQDLVIRDLENELMMVQGAAGSGKTSVALHRVAYLMYQGLSSRLSSNNIVIISPNALFARYISRVLPELGEENVISLVFEEMLGKILADRPLQTRNQYLERLITTSRYQKLMEASLEFKTSQPFLIILNRFIEDVPARWLVFRNYYYGGQCIASKASLREKVLSWRKGTPLGFRLEQLEEHIIELVKAAHKKRFKREDYFKLKKEIRAFTLVEVKRLYAILIANRAYFYSLAEDLALPGNIEEILKFTGENLGSSEIFYDDAGVMAYMQLKIDGSSAYKNIKQVVVDEAQDYYPRHYEILRLLFSEARYTVLGDINQTLGKQADLTLYRRIGQILAKPKSTLVTLDKSFRCTNEILLFSAKLLKGNAAIKSFNRSGAEPRVFTAPDQAALAGLITAETKLCAAEGYQSICLIGKTERNTRRLYDLLKGSIDLQVLKNESESDLRGVFILPVYLAKGLEFDAVLVCDADRENYHSETDRQLLYIACTRALHRLNLFCLQEPSPLLSD